MAFRVRADLRGVVLGAPAYQKSGNAVVVFGIGIFVTKCSWGTQRLCLGVFNTFNSIMDLLSEVGLHPITALAPSLCD